MTEEQLTHLGELPKWNMQLDLHSPICLITQHIPFCLLNKCILSTSYEQDIVSS